MPKLPRLGAASPLLGLSDVVRKPAKDAEHQEQAMLFQWASLAAGRVPELGLLFAIPNFAGFHGSKAGRIRSGARAKAEGRKKGVPDMFLPVPRGRYHGLFLELKARGGSASVEQKAWLMALRDQGYRAEVAVGWEAAAAAIEEYLALTAPLIAAVRP